MPVATSRSLREYLDKHLKTALDAFDLRVKAIWTKSATPPAPRCPGAASPGNAPVQTARRYSAYTTAQDKEHEFGPRKGGEVEKGVIKGETVQSSRGNPVVVSLVMSNRVLPLLGHAGSWRRWRPPLCP